MLKEIKIISLLALAFVVGGQVSASSIRLTKSNTKQATLVAGVIATTGYVVSKMISLYPYFEPNYVYDKKTGVLLDKIAAQYSKHIDLLQDYDYKQPTEQLEVDQALLEDIEQLSLTQIKELQTELELRFARLDSYLNNKHIYDKWYDSLSEAAAGLGHLVEWLEKNTQNN